MIFKISERWEIITLEELNTRESASILPSNFGDTIFELWSVPAFSTGKPEYIKGNEIGSNKQKVQFGDVLLCKINPRINRVWKVGEKGEYPQIASTEWIVIHCPQVNPDYLVYYFQQRTFREALCAEVSGVGGSLIRARPQSVFKLKVKIPPLNEQKRIVSKIESLQQRSDRASTHLEAIKPLLDQFRRSVLSAAFRGDLTRDWREQNPDVEPAEVLLERIKNITQSKNHDKNPLPNPFSIPLQWRWVTLSDICLYISDGDHSAPPKAEKGVPFLVISNIRNGRIDFTDIRYVPEDYYQKLPKHRLAEKGDIIYSVVGSYGIPVLIDTDKKFCFQRHIALLKINRLINNKYLLYCLKSKFVYEQATEVATGTAQLTVTLTGLRKIKVPLIPSEEQQEIVRRIENLFKLADSIEQQYQQAIDQLENLNQSILAKAFRGELVPQDPDDEPASVLLERIKAEKAKAEQPKRIPKKTSKRESEQLNLFE